MLRVYPKCNQKTAIQFLDYLLERLPFRVVAIQTDNGAEFQSGFHWHVLDRGIRHTYIKPATPRQWEDYYNFDRPHGAPDGQTPYERLKQKTTQP